MKSLRTRMLLTVACIVLATTGAIMFFAQTQSEKAIFMMADESAHNILSTVMLKVQGDYRSLLFYRDVALERRKAELKNIADVVLSHLRGQYVEYQQGRMTEAEAKRAAIRQLKSLRYDGGVGYVWINDMGAPIPRMIMHPTVPGLDGQILDDPSFNCALGVGENLFKAFVDVCREDGEGYVDYLWPKPTSDGLTAEQPKLSYVTLFKEWGWVIGTGLYIDDIDQETEKRRETMIAELRRTFNEVRVREHGYLFLFTGDLDMLIHPTRAGEDFARQLNPQTGNLILEELAAVAHGPNGYLDYVWEKPGRPRGEKRFLKRSHMAYFEPLDWYIGASIYMDDIRTPARALRRRIFGLSLLCLLVAFVLSLSLSKSLVKPLQRLTSAARGIEGAGELREVMPESGTVETRELGRVLNRMIGSVRSALQDKEGLLAALESSNDALVRANEELKNENAERGRAEEALRQAHDSLVESEARFRAAFTTSSDAIAITRKEDGVLVEVNEGFTALLGYERDALVGHPARELRMWPDLDEWRQLRSKLERNQDNLTSEEVRLRTSDGSIRKVLLSANPMTLRDIPHVLWVARDVTERIRLEEMMVQSEKMLSVGGLAAGMAHEINNPLAGILQNLQVMKTRLGQDTPKNRRAAEEAGITLSGMNAYMEARDILTMISSIELSGRRAAKIVDNMLSFSRKGSAKPGPHDARELLDKSVALAESDYDLKKKYDFRKIEVLREYEEEVPPVLCEASQVQQVFLNLLRNGAEAMTENWEDMAGARFVLRVRREGSMVRIEIEDNGPGMEEKVRKRIFEPFFTTKDVGKGTGLGLSVSYFIIAENAHGTMAVESRPGEGAKFIIRLPQA